MRLTRRARRLPVVVAALAVVAAFAPAVTAAPGPTALGGTTVVRAARPASVDVRLARAATVSTPLLDSPDLAVDGGGRVVAFALVGTEKATAETRLVGGADRLGTRFLMGAGRLDTGSYGEGKTYPDTVTLPKGTYRLYVVPDGRPATFTLRLHGLSGRVALAPSRPANGVVEPGDAVALPGVTKTGMAAHTLARDGLAVHLLHGRVTASAAWEVVLCHGRGAARPAPGCPDGKGHSVSGHRLPETGVARAWVQVLGWMPPDTHHLSGTFTGAAYVEDLDYVSLWLTL